MFGLLVQLAMACGSGSASINKGGAPSDGGAPLVDAPEDVKANNGSGDEASADGAEAEAAGTRPYFGKFQFYRRDLGGTTAFGADGAFQQEGALSPVLECPSGALSSGSCCFIAASTDAGESPLASLSAGSLTLTVGGTVLTSLAYDATAMQYAAFSASNPPATTVWAGGEAMQVSASGGTVDGFEGTVQMPDALQGLSVTAGGTLTVSQSADWTVTWTPSNSVASVLFDLSNPGSQIKCAVDQSAGSVTVPSALLARIQDMGGSSLDVGTIATVDASSANAIVEVGALNDVFADVLFRP
jgi:hypothetical protein